MTASPSIPTVGAAEPLYKGDVFVATGYRETLVVSRVFRKNGRRSYACLDVKEKDAKRPVSIFTFSDINFKGNRGVKIEILEAGELRQRIENKRTMKRAA